MTNIDNWQANLEALKAHVAQTGHFPSKHTKLNNWCRYQRKRIKAGVMRKSIEFCLKNLLPAVPVSIQEVERRKIEVTR